jgi:hypothetical protein
MQLDFIVSAELPEMTQLDHFELAYMSQVADSKAAWLFLCCSM